MSYIGRLEHQGGAKATTLLYDFPAGALTFTIADPTGWPDGSVGPFYVDMDKGELNEEKILCASRSGDSVVVWSDPVAGNGRGADGTVDVRHGINAKVEHIWTAVEADQANAHLFVADGAHGYPPKASIVVQGGEARGMTKVTLAGPQTEDEFRVRNVRISDVPPTSTDGENGDIWIVRA